MSAEKSSFILLLILLIGSVCGADARYASNPKPVDKETEAPINPVLSWTPGVDADNHDIYFGPNEVNVTYADHSDPEFKGNTVTEKLCYYTLGYFDSNDANYYYWRIDANHPTSGFLKGDIWRFKIDNFWGVDDFDPYTATGSGAAENGELQYVWRPNPVSGAFTELEPTTARDGKSMKYDYVDTQLFGYYSEVDADVCDLPSAVGNNWNAIGAKALQLYFYGQSGNDVNEQMYVKLTHGATTKKVMYDGDAGNIGKERWFEWNIPLTAFTGIDLNDVNTITIGFGDGNDPYPASGSGTVYFEDIRLYPRRCRPEMTTGDVDGDCFVDYNDLEIMADDWLDQGTFVPSTDPGDANLVMRLPMNEGNWALLKTLDTTANHNDGSQRGNPVWVADHDDANTSGHALDFNGVNDYLLVASSVSLKPPVVSLAVWVKANDCGNFEANPYIHKAAYKLWHTTGNRIEFTIHTDGGSDYSAVYPVDDSFNGVWHHLAGTFDGNSVKLYVDGALKDTVSFAQTTLSALLQTVQIASTTVSTERYTGMLDEVRIYNKGLSAEEVGYLATNGTGHLPLTSPANLYNAGLTIINFKDFTMLADGWLEEQLWP